MRINSAFNRCAAFLIVLAVTGVVGEAGAQSDQAPVQVYILSGQSNMVGAGNISSGGERWGKEFVDPVVSLYEGDYDPAANYDEMTPTETAELESFGGVQPQAYPDGGTPVVRGTYVPTETKLVEFRPGYGSSQFNIMTVGDTEVYRREPGQKEAKYTHLQVKQGEKLPFKIVYLEPKGANGLGWTMRVDVPGTLTTVVHSDGEFPYLKGEEGGFKGVDNVWYRGLVTATGNGPLKPGVTGSKLGPEYGFGHEVSKLHDGPVLLIKSSQGNRSLAWDFLPPGSERYEVDGVVYAGYKDSPAQWAKGTEPEPINWYAGKQYDECFEAVHGVLNDFGTEYPQWADRGYEIAGFVWFQGHKDSGSAVYQQRYEQNLVHLIKTLRKEFEAPDAPFVVGTIGFQGDKMEADFPQYFEIVKAQLAVDGDSGSHPEFKGNVKTVDTRPYWRTEDVSPRSQDYHYHQNAGTYTDIGEALGRGMMELKQAAE